MKITRRDLDALDSVVRRAEEDISKAASVPRIFPPKRSGGSTSAP
jgi:hypothetical protein